jgi:hypothetical protein
VEPLQQAASPAAAWPTGRQQMPEPWSQVPPSQQSASVWQRSWLPVPPAATQHWPLGATPEQHCAGLAGVPPAATQHLLWSQTAEAAQQSMSTEQVSPMFAEQQPPVSPQRGAPLSGQQSLDLLHES